MDQLLKANNEKHKGEPLSTKYSFIVCVEKLVKRDQLFTKQLQTHCQQPTKICVRSGTADLNLPIDLSTDGGTVCWSLSDKELKKKKKKQLWSLNGINNTTKRQLMCAVKWDECVFWTLYFVVSYLNIRCSVIALIGLLFRDFFCVFFDQYSSGLYNK